MVDQFRSATFRNERSESGSLQRLERGIHICHGAFIVHVSRGAAYSMCHQVRIPKSRRNSVLIVPTYLILLQSVSNSKGASLFVSFSFSLQFRLKLRGPMHTTILGQLGCYAGSYTSYSQSHISAPSAFIGTLSPDSGDVVIGSGPNQ